jgi:hypothetical protein
MKAFVRIFAAALACSQSKTAPLSESRFQDVFSRED